MAAGRLLPLLFLLAAAGGARPGPNGEGSPPALKKHEKHAKRSDVDPAFAEHCTAPAVTGPCRASFLHWYYSPDNGTCRQFIYGGCRGNENNYPTREECLTRCAPKPEDSSGAGFRRDLGSARALVLGLLLAVVAAVALAYVTFVAFKICRKKLSFLGTGRGPGENKERLMSHAYTA